MRWFSRRPDPVGRHSVSPRRRPPEPVVVVPSEPGAPQSGVYLGFADGVVLQLAASDPRVRTFRALARTLTQGHT